MTFERSEGHSIIRASHASNPGNPTKGALSAGFDIARDRGAKALIGGCDLDIVGVDIGEAAVIDVDKEEDLQRQGGALSYMR